MNTRRSVSGDKIWVFGEIGVVIDRERKREEGNERGESRIEKGRVEKREKRLKESEEK